MKRPADSKTVSDFAVVRPAWSLESSLLILMVLNPCPPADQCEHRMRKTCQDRLVFQPRSLRFVLLSLLLSASCASSRGQATVETAGSTSVSATAATGAKRPGFPATDLPQNQNKSPHLAISSGPSQETTNRQALEQHAGPDAGKLLLRSTPSPAQVWIDGVPVGNTPVLLILAPGKYEVEVRGQRLDRAKRSVDLLPHETRVVALTLAARYPSRVAFH
jgi:hypothetical protein